MDEINLKQKLIRGCSAPYEFLLLKDHLPLK